MNLTTRVLEVDADKPSPDAISDAVRVLRAGGLVAFPTETVYGLGARALDAKALGRVFQAKGRPQGHPLIAHVLDEKGARALAAEWSPLASRLAQAFWPGPLSLVVPRAASVPAQIAGGGPSIAVRAPKGGVARALLDAFGEPIAAPSANRYQTLSPTTALHVMTTVEGRIELVLDGGPCATGIESTVVDLRGNAPKLLRPGAVSIAALRALAPDLVVDRPDAPSTPPPSARRASPGMDARHYAPRARMKMVAGRAAAIAASYQEPQGTRVGLVLKGNQPGAHEMRGGDVYALYLPDDPVAYAKDLFATLHALDGAGAALIIVEAVPQDDAWAAVADRLRRASTPR